MICKMIKICMIYKSYSLASLHLCLSSHLPDEAGNSLNPFPAMAAAVDPCLTIVITTVTRAPTKAATPNAIPVAAAAVNM